MRCWLYGVLFLLSLQGPVLAGRYFDIAWLSAFVIRLPHHINQASTNRFQQITQTLTDSESITSNQEHFALAMQHRINQIHSLPYFSQSNTTYLRFMNHLVFNYVFAENDEVKQYQYRLLEMALASRSPHLHALASLEIRENWDRAMVLDVQVLQERLEVVERLYREYLAYR